MANDILIAKIAPTPNAVSRPTVAEPDHKKPFGLPAERPIVATTTMPNPTQTASDVELAGNKNDIDSSQLALVPNNATGVGIIDMNSPFLLSLLALYDTEGHEAELAFHLEVFKELFDSDTITFATFENGDLFIVPGVFDGLNYVLESEGYAELTYKGFELWEGSGRSISFGESVAIVQGRTISGTPEIVLDVLDRVATGSGFLTQNRDSGIGRVLNRIDKGMFAFASVEDCNANYCEAEGATISMDDDNSVVDMKYVMLFGNECAAKSAVTEAESDSYLDNDLLYIDVRRDGEVVIVDTAFEGEAFLRDFMDAIQEGISGEWLPGTDA